MQPPDKIFSAIAAIVAEEGVWNASVDKIATRLGMSKSSLYFYFENRDEMISTMLERERKQLMTLYAERENRYSTFQDKLFCYVLIFASYLLNKPDLLITFNWIRIQGIKVHMEKPDLDKLEEEFSFLFKNFKDHDVETFGLHIVELISLLNMQIIREVMNGFHYDIERHRIYTRILTLFNCFFHGIGGTNT
jgi:AcrR family transcriptional regulator